MTMIKNYIESLCYCVRNRRPDFYLLVAIALFAPAFSVVTIHLMLQEPLETSSFFNEVLAIIYVFLLSSALSKPMLIYYSFIKPDKELYELTLSIVDHISIWCLIALILLSRGDASNTNADLVAALLFSISIVRLGGRIRNLYSSGKFING